MLRKIVFSGAGLLLLATPFISSAATLEDLQAQIQALLGQITALQGQMQTVAPTPPLQPDDYGTGTSVGNYCPKLSVTMQKGSRDATTRNQVTELQIFLTDYYNLDENVVVGGYFGKLTHQYVVQFQTEQGLPALGIAGQLTRAKIAQVCGEGAPTPVPSFSATPTSGPAPLTVSFTANAKGIDPSRFKIDFGDGSAKLCNSTFCPGAGGWTLQHSYTTVGTYTATLLALPSASYGAGAYKDIGRTTIKVGGATPPPSSWECTPRPLSTSLGFNSFYKKGCIVGGIPVISSGVVSDDAIREAARILKSIFDGRPEIVSQFIEHGLKIGVIGTNEQTTSLPEYALLSNDTSVDWDVRARGLGATIGRPLASAGEENLMCSSADRYRGQSILIHELGHTAKDLGLVLLDASFTSKLDAIYHRAITKGLWKDTYAATNSEEYWTTGVQAYFDASGYSYPANGINNEIATRENLESYDPELYALIASFFPTTWRYTCSGGSQFPAPACHFSAREISIAPNEPVTISWTSVNATSAVWESGGNDSVSGSKTFDNISGNRGFALTVSGPGGTATCNTKVYVSKVPPTTPTPKRIFLTSGSSWNVPSDWNSSSNTIEVIGGGGQAAQYGRGGGGGGAYSKITNISLTAGNPVTYQIGAGGTGGSATAGGTGGDTWLCNSSSKCASIADAAIVVGAKGGAGGLSNVDAAGGAAGSGVGTTKYSGGSGLATNAHAGGGGGGAAGPNGNGNNGASGTGLSGTGTAGAGGSGGAGLGGRGGTAGNPDGDSGGKGTEWDGTHGSGGGGGGGVYPLDGIGGMAGNYGGGSGSPGIDASSPAGAQGIIVITYTPVPNFVEASASDRNANLANALTALESALKALFAKLGQ